MKDTILFEARLIDQKIKFNDYEFSPYDENLHLSIFTSLSLYYIDDFIFPTSLCNIPFTITYRSDTNPKLYINIDKLAELDYYFHKEVTKIQIRRLWGVSPIKLVVDLDNIIFNFEFEKGILY